MVVYDKNLLYVSKKFITHSAEKLRYNAPSTLIGWLMDKQSNTHKEDSMTNNPYKVAISSMIGTAIEFYDYYIYAAAAVLVFSTQFFDKSDPATSMLFSLSTLALALVARPLGSVIFGYFGDKIGRKKHSLPRF